MVGFVSCPIGAIRSNVATTLTHDVPRETLFGCRKAHVTGSRDVPRETLPLVDLVDDSPSLCCPDRRNADEFAIPLLKELALSMMDRLLSVRSSTLGNGAQTTSPTTNAWGNDLTDIGYLVDSKAITKRTPPMSRCRSQQRNSAGTHFGEYGSSRCSRYSAGLC